MAKGRLEKMKTRIKLQTDSILHVPLSIHEENFTFIVNDEEFQTNKFCADLLSPKISKMHHNDPTLSQYYINTEHKGNFKNFLDLLTFKTKDFDENNLEFISELVEELSIEDIDINIPKVPISKENVIDLIVSHSKLEHFYSKELKAEIDFLSCHLYEFKEEEERSLFKIKYDMIEKVLTNDKIHIDTEDQLLRIVNNLYMKDSKYASLYEFVIFRNVGKESIKEFVSIFDIDDMTKGIWKSLSESLFEMREEEMKGRYKKKGTDILFSSGNLKGIFAHLQQQSNIDDEVNVTASSSTYGDKKLLLDIENTQNQFYTSNSPNSWICFEFKHHKVTPTHYTIRTYRGKHHPRSWVIEGSETGNEWTQLDEEKDCSHLNESNIVHTFVMKNSQTKEFKYIRMKSTGPDWNNSHYLDVCSIEFYGKLI